MGLLYCVVGVVVVLMVVGNDIVRVGRLVYLITSFKYDIDVLA